MLMTGYVGVKTLAAETIYFQVVQVMSCCSFGLMMVTCTLVG